MDSESVHRKIELQTPEDLTYLISNVRRAAQTRLNEAFPPVDGADGDDELRSRIEVLVNEVCYSVQRDNSLRAALDFQVQ
jgi:kinetochor protein Mis14/NSL1